MRERGFRNILALFRKCRPRLGRRKKVIRVMGRGMRKYGIYWA